MNNKASLMNPFPGLRSFRGDEDYLFFGREQQTAELVERLQRNRFIAVVGTSGQGKSSLVRCGLLSRLQGGGMTEAGAHWQIAVMHPGGDPFRHLVEALIEAELYDRGTDDAVPQLLATLRRSQFGLIEAVRQAALPAGTSFLLVVDQFEEIFRFDEVGSAESEAANDFVAMLREACAQTDVPIYIVATMRSDFIGDCARFEGLAESVNRGEYLIPRLSRDQFKAAIEGPIRVAGGKIAPRLLQRLLNDVGEEQDQLPCLQHALMRTWRVWQQRAAAEALDLEDYAQVGKMSQALSVHADEVYFALASERERELCVAMFKALTVEGSEKRGIRRPRRLQTLCGILGVNQDELRPVIDAFRAPEVSFLMPPPEVELRDSTVIDLSHESLMRVWTRLREWVDEEAKSVGIFRRLSESAALWRQGKTGFYRDPELSIARAWLETSRPNATWAGQYDGAFDDAMAFLQASTEAAGKDAREQEVARQRELTQAKALAEAERTRAEEQTRFAVRLKWLVRGVGAVALVALGAMAFALVARREAQENATAAAQSEVKADAARAMAAMARTQAEKLVAFLLEDFHAELAPIGRNETMEKLAAQAVQYFDGLPASMRTNETRRNRAVALFRQGQATMARGNAIEGGKLMRDAHEELEQLYQGGDLEPSTVLALATVVGTRGTMAGIDDDEHQKRLEQAIGLLRPLVQSMPNSMAVRLELAQNIFRRAVFAEGEAALPYYAEAREILLEAGALEYANLTASSLYALITQNLGLRMRTLRNEAEEEKYYREALGVSTKVLAKRPGDLSSLGVTAAVNYFLSEVESRRFHEAEAWRYALAAIEAYELTIRFDPSDKNAWNWLARGRRWLGDLSLNAGRISDATRYYREAFETVKEQKSSAESLDTAPNAALQVVRLEAFRGNREAAAAALLEARKLRDAVERDRPSMRGAAAEIWRFTYELARRRTRWAFGEFEVFCRQAEETGEQIRKFQAGTRLTNAQRREVSYALEQVDWDLGRGYVMLGRWTEAEAAVNRYLQSEGGRRSSANAEQSRQWLAIALAHQGRGKEALAALDEGRRGNYAKGDRNLLTTWTFARGCYARVAALSTLPGTEQQRLELINAGLAALQALSAEARDLGEHRALVRMLEDERAKLPAKSP